MLNKTLKYSLLVLSLFMLSFSGCSLLGGGDDAKPRCGKSECAKSECPYKKDKKVCKVCGKKDCTSKTCAKDVCSKKKDCSKCKKSSECPHAGKKADK